MMCVVMLMEVIRSEGWQSSVALALNKKRINEDRAIGWNLLIK
jgi:hypothetical protein